MTLVNIFSKLWDYKIGLIVFSSSSCYTNLTKIVAIGIVVVLCWIVA